MSRARDLAAFVSNADGDIKFDTDTLFIDSSANKVGIRTDSPDTELHIAGGANPTLQLTAYEGTQDCDVQILPIRAELSGSESIMAFKTNDGTSLNEVMRLDEDGNVGIGTSSSSYGLSVAKTTTGTHAIDAVNNTTGAGTTRLILRNPNSDTNGNGFQIINNANDGVVNLLNYKNTDLALWTNATERMRVLSSGGITFNGDTATANALDDYEEGTWTPTVNNGTITVNSGAHYTKIGRLVTITINSANLSNVTTTSTLEISGLPFSANTSSAVGNFMAQYRDDSTAIMAFIPASSSMIRLYVNSKTNAYTSLGNSIFNSVSGNNFYITATYHSS